jgi:O-antigen/teichoic acid export membrane protein
MPLQSLVSRNCDLIAIRRLNQERLADTTLTALKWGYLGTVARAVSSLAVGIVLARLLGPEPFGLLAGAMLIIGLGNLVADLGMGPALVQSEVISDCHIRSAFTIQICMGIGLMVALNLFAPLIAAAFKQPQLSLVVRTLSVVFLFQAFGVVAISLLRRQMDFKRIQIVQVCSYMLGFFILGVPLAILGLGIWSLVIAQIVQAAFFSLLCYLQVQHVLKPSFELPSNGLFRFGSKVLLTNIINWTISNIDNFFIGHFFDIVSLGLYSRVYILVTTPMHNLVVTLQNVMFPAYTRMRNDQQTIGRLYLACVGAISMLMLPVYGCMALVPSTVIRGIFGERWEAAVPLLIPLALAMPFHAVMALGGPLLWACNRVEREFRAQLFTALALVGTLLLTSRVSLTVMAWGVLAISIFRFVLVTHASLQSVGVRWLRLFNAMRGGAVLLIPTGAMIYLCDYTLTSPAGPVLLRLGLDAIMGASAFFGVFLLAPEAVFSLETRWIAEQLANRMPSRIQPLIRRILPSAEVSL